MTWHRSGWQVFGVEQAVSDWAAAARPIALSVASDPRERQKWLRHGGTWFVGVDSLPNDATGAVASGPSLTGAAITAASDIAGSLPLHRAQVSITYPGYPLRDADEGEAAFQYRLRRDAAHVDGLLPIGPERRRYLREPHAYILGVPLTDASAGAAPLVVYEGSHEIMRAAFRRAFDGCPPQDMGQIDVTDIYQAARKRCFEICPRVEITAQPGAAILVHRLALHGIAPWAEDADAAPEGRAIAYFRPCFPSMSDWLTAPWWR